MPNPTRRMLLTQAGTWLLAGQAELPAAGEKPLARLGIVTDVHYADKPTAGTRQYRASAEKLTEAVERWNALGTDAVMELGDLVDASPTVEQETGDLRRILGILRKARAPQHFALGNHCVMTLTKQQFLAEWRATRSWYSFPLRSYRCIVLDSAFSSDGRPYGGREGRLHSAGTDRVAAEGTGLNGCAGDRLRASPAGRGQPLQREQRGGGAERVIGLRTGGGGVPGT
jgi:hypothetical protein